MPVAIGKDLVEQINILPDQNVEIVPRIGNHIVLLGKLPEDVDRKKQEEAIADFFNHKMERLEKFYRYGLSEVGWNKYSYVNIEFDNQIICRKGKAETHKSVAEPISTPTASQEGTNAPSDVTSEATTEESNANSSLNKTKSDAKKKGSSADNTIKKEKTVNKTDKSTEKKKAGKQASKTKSDSQTAKQKADNKPTTSKTGKATDNKKKKSSN